MDDTQAALPAHGPTAAAAATHASPLAGIFPLPLPRWFAAMQTLLVCGIPTQLVVMMVLVLGSNMPIVVDGDLSLELVAIVSLVDTALIALLIRLFLAIHGETSKDIFIGRRPVWGEIWRGLALLPVVFVSVTGVVLLLRAVAPWLHTVDRNPLEAYMRSPMEAVVFMIVVVLAGGVREELQRAFILHRFEQRLGGVRVGLTVFTLVFGALHFNQGLDVAVAVGLLGLLWGVLYIKRRSVVMSMVNHASFDLAQVIQGALARML